MKKTKSNLITKLNLILKTFVLAVPISFSSVIYATNISINGSPGLTINGNVNYNYTSFPKVVDFHVTEPLVCTSLSDSLASTIVEIDDANANPISGVNGLKATNYDVFNNLVSFSTDDTIQCASVYGLHQESVFAHGFEVSQNDVEILMLDSNEQLFPNNMPVADLQIVSYYYIVRNNGSETVNVDVLEYFLTDQSIPYFTDMDGSEWSCSSTALGATDCGDESIGDGFVKLTNAIIEPGEELEVSVIREVDVPNGTLGQNFDLLAAVFNKSSTDTIPLNNVEHREFGSVSNTPPEITFSSMPAFAEGDSSQIVGFSVSDPNMDDALITVTATSSDPSIIPNSPSSIIIGGSGSNRTIQLQPERNANTEVNSVTITIHADDGINPSTEQFTVNITPVNDRPSFDFACINNVVDSQTGQITCADSQNKALTIASFIENISMGNSFDDLAQSVDEYIISSISDPNDIIHSDFGGKSISIDELTNELIFSLVNGNYGTATVGLQMRDSGGLPGFDMSIEKQFTITVPIPQYNFTANVSGLPEFEFLALRVVPVVGDTLNNSTQVNGSLQIGVLELGSDYTISIQTQTPGAGCSIDGSNGNGEIVGTNLSDHVNFSVTCGAP